MLKRPQHSPYQAAPGFYGKSAQDTIPEDESPLLDKKQKRNVQQVIGSILYYGRAIDKTTFPALSSITSKQAKAMEMTEIKCM